MPLLCVVGSNEIDGRRFVPMRDRHVLPLVISGGIVRRHHYVVVVVVVVVALHDGLSPCVFAAQRLADRWRRHLDDLVVHRLAEQCRRRMRTRAAVHALLTRLGTRLGAFLAAVVLGTCAQQLERPFLAHHWIALEVHERV